MAELVIRLQKYIGVSQFNWDTFEVEMATSAEDVRMAVEWAGYAGEPATSICLKIGTCFGGSTFEGREIYKYLTELGLPIRTRILGFAASMATILMLVGDECEIDASAQLLVHGPSGGTEGTVTDMRSGLQMVINEHEALRDIYMARTGQTAEVVEEWMSKDTFFTAKEALAAGLVTKVLPIAPKAAPALTDAQASARRAQYAGIVARAATRPARPRASTPKPKAKSAATPASTTPMATKKTTAGAAVARRPAAAAAPATKPAAAKPAALDANQKAVAAFAKQLGVNIKMEGEAAEVEETTAEVVETVLANGDGSLFTDGELVEGSAVFNDEALSVATADGTYGAEDGRDIVVAAGVVDSITTAEAEAAAPASTEAIAAAITAALAPMTKRMEEMEASFKKAVPPMPRAKTGVQAPDAKTPTPKPKAAHHATL
jgi:ATP-dependent protease ClpP protease subunit